MLADQADPIIGGDAHRRTDTAAVLRVPTALGDVLAQSTADGHRAIFEMAVAHTGLRVWAIKCTNCYGSGIARFLQAQGGVARLAR